MADLVTRKEWGARPSKGPYTPLLRARGVKVHYTGSRVDPACLDDHDLCVAMVKSIQAHHMDGNGWMDIAYSMVACCHRRVFVGRGLNRRSAANGPGLNAGHYAVLGLVGNAGLVTPPDLLLHGIRDAIDYLVLHGNADTEIKGHRDGYSTDCPGDALYAWVRKGAPRPGTDPGPGPPTWPGRYLRYPVPLPLPNGHYPKYPPLMTGEDVRIWQAQMKARGYDLDVDRVYGPQSRDVCRQFQRDAGLEVDGIVGPATWAAGWRS